MDSAELLVREHFRIQPTDPGDIKGAARTCANYRCACTDCLNHEADRVGKANYPCWTDPVYLAEIDDTTHGESD